MKKTIQRFLGALFALGLVACGQASEDGEGGTGGTGGGGGGGGGTQVVDLEVSPLSLVLGIQQERKIEVVAKDADGEKVEVPVFFRSADPEIALVAGDGTVTGRSKGQTRIEIEAGKVGAVVAVTVEGAPARLELPESVKVALGRTFPIDVILEDADGEDLDPAMLEWTSEDPGIAKVEEGEVVAVGWGETVLTARVNELEAFMTVRTLLRFSEIGVARDHTCGLTTVGTVYCWGLAREGRLGFETEEWQVVAPTRAVGNGARFSALTVGSRHACALDDAGRARCWGANDAGQLGAPGESFSDSPKSVPGLLGLVAIASRGEQTCALDADGKAHCWGGPVGPQPTAVEGGPFVELAVGARHACGLAEEGKVFCWGENGLGQLGRSDLGASEEPVEVEGLAPMRAIAAGHDHVCGITEEGSLVHCWGSNSRGELGRGSVGESGEPGQVHNPFAFKFLALGEATSCAVSEGGTYCWGANDTNQVGSDTVDPEILVPTKIASGPWTFQKIYAGSRHTCGVTAQSEAYCWGDNSLGQLGVPSCDEETDICLYPEYLIGQR